MKYAHLFEELRMIRTIEAERSRAWLGRQMGINASTLEKWELGYSAVNLEKLNGWADALGYELVVILKKK